MTTLEAIERFLAGDEPHLAVKDPELSAGKMKELGFEEKEGYWIISREDAQELYESLGEVNYEQHWTWEQERDDLRPGSRR